MCGLVLPGRDAHRFRAAPGYGAHVRGGEAVGLEHGIARGIDFLGRPRHLEAEQSRAPAQSLAMLSQLEDLAIVGALPLEHRRGIMQRVGQDMDLGVAPRHQLAVEPDPAVAVVEGALVLLQPAEPPRLGEAGRVGKRAPRPGLVRQLGAAPRGSVDRRLRRGRPAPSSSTAKPASVVPLGLATRRATAPCFHRCRGHPRGAEHGLERDCRGDLGGEPARSRPWQARDEPGGISGARAGNRSDRRQLAPRPKSTSPSRAQRTGRRAAASAHRRRPRCTARPRPAGLRPAGWASRGRSPRRSESACASSRLRPLRGSKRARRRASLTVRARGATSSSFCGLTASTISLGGGPASLSAHRARAFDRFAARTNHDNL